MGSPPPKNTYFIQLLHIRLMGYHRRGDRKIVRPTEPGSLLRGCVLPKQLSEEDTKNNNILWIMYLLRWKGENLTEPYPWTKNYIQLTTTGRRGTSLSQG